MRRSYFLLAALALCAAPVHAYTITADAQFTVEFVAVDPPYTGEGFFSLRENRWTAFEFSMLGFTWDLSDLPSLTCPRSECRVFDVTGHGEELILDQIRIAFGDEHGSGVLLYDFIHSNFSIQFHAGEFDFVGTSENGEAGSVLEPFSSRINVPEPSALAVLGLGLLGLGLTTPTQKPRRGTHG